MCSASTMDKVLLFLLGLVTKVFCKFSCIIIFDYRITIYCNTMLNVSTSVDYIIVTSIANASC